MESQEEILNLFFKLSLLFLPIFSFSKFQTHPRILSHLNWEALAPHISCAIFLFLKETWVESNFLFIEKHFCTLLLKGTPIKPNYQFTAENFSSASFHCTLKAHIQSFERLVTRNETKGQHSNSNSLARRKMSLNFFPKKECEKNKIKIGKGQLERTASNPLHSKNIIKQTIVTDQWTRIKKKQINERM